MESTQEEDVPEDEEFELNVSGVRLKNVKRSTLMRVEESMLGRMFAPRNEDMLQKNPDDGSVFIQGDGEVFKVILSDPEGGASPSAARALMGPDP